MSFGTTVKIRKQSPQETTKRAVVKPKLRFLHLTPPIAMVELSHCPATSAGLKAGQKSTIEHHKRLLPVSRHQRNENFRTGEV
ncbi:hypothetical protein NUU61_005264 [Penicillium alfredii]|uniref:Uncharacterized protein n=1 Tax=Penicillium alfredii TaxID=1506179 RepID=A0A9W9K7E7_9EURO|nr:uncharacterized protein NUU61_005264 [Penicillium alfredii]KAJ5095908.1 hypothetical protein NUU61_005264 [Penicillium alfredii]